MSDSKLKQTMSSVVNSLSALYDAQVKQTLNRTTIDTAISAAIGEGFTSGATVSAAIAAEETRAKGIQSGLRTNLDTVSGYVDTLKGADTVDGSVAKSVKDAKDELSGLIGGTYTTNSTVYDAITGQVSRATAAQEALDARLDVIEGTGDGSIIKAVSGQQVRAKAVEDIISAGVDSTSAAIQVLNGTETTTGSVKKAVKDAKDLLSAAIGTNSDASISAATLWGAISQVNTELSLQISTNKSTTDSAIEAEATARSTMDTFISGAIGGYTPTNTVKSAIDTLSANAISVAGSSAIKVTGDTPAKTVSLKLNGTALSQSDDGLKCELKIAKQATAESGYAATYFLTDSTGTNVIGQKINLLKDKFLKAVDIVTGEGVAVNGTTLVKGKKYFHFEFNTSTSSADGDTSTTHIYIDVNDLYDSYTGTYGVCVNNDTNQISAAIDGNSESFLTVGVEGIKLAGVSSFVSTSVTAEETRAKGIEDAISAAVGAGYCASSTVASAIAAEETRAKGIEESLQTDLTTLTTNFNAKLAGVTDTVTGLIDAEETARETMDETLSSYIQAGFNIDGDLSLSKVQTNSVSAQLTDYDNQLSGILTQLAEVKAKIDTL